MDQFVIAWKHADTNVTLYAADNEGGIIAVPDIAEAMRFETFEEGWEVFQRWNSAFIDLDGAVLRPHDLEAQFDPNRPSPRPAFNKSDEAWQIRIGELVEDAAAARTTAEAAHLEATEVRLKLFKTVPVVKEAVRLEELVAAIRKSDPGIVAAAEKSLAARHDVKA